MQTQGNEVDYVCDKRGFFTGGKISQRHLIKQCIFFALTEVLSYRPRNMLRFHVQMSTPLTMSLAFTIFYLLFKMILKEEQPKCFLVKLRGKCFH